MYIKSVEVANSSLLTDLLSNLKTAVVHIVTNEEATVITNFVFVSFALEDLGYQLDVQGCLHFTLDFEPAINCSNMLLSIVVNSKKVAIVATSPLQYNAII